MLFNLPLKAKCLVDSNIIYYAISFGKTDVTELLAKVYGQVIIHMEVYNELSSAGKAAVQDKWDSGEWEKFDPSTLTTTENILYRQYTRDIQAELKKVDAERGKKGQRGLGEIHSMAAALILNAEYICSNDFSIEMVIENLNLIIYINNDEENPYLIAQHKLLEFCKICVENTLCNRNTMKAFFQSSLTSIYEEDPEQYKHLMKLFKAEIPPQE